MKNKLTIFTAILLLTSTATYAGGGSKHKPPQAQSAQTLAGGGSKSKPPQAYSASVPWYVVWLGW